MFKWRYKNPTTNNQGEKKYAPHQWNRSEYGVQVQKEMEDDTLE